jgi:hypothetical protein
MVFGFLLISSPQSQIYLMVDVLSSALLYLLGSALEKDSIVLHRPLFVNSATLTGLPPVTREEGYSQTRREVCS